MIQSILIIEDEKPNADRLIRLLKQIKPEAHVVAVLDSITDSVDWLLTQPLPDLILLDVRLSDGLSFDIFKKTNIKAPIIFTTAYDEYAIKAFKLNSIDYLLKPIDADELKIAIDKFESFQPSNKNEGLHQMLEQLKPKEYRSRFLLPFRDGYQTLLVTDIDYFYSEMKITRAKLKNGEALIIPQTMEELEQQLNPKYFFRANRQFIIHIDAVEQVHNSFNGKLKVTIKKQPETEIIVSREKAHQLKNWMDF